MIDKLFTQSINFLLKRKQILIIIGSKMVILNVMHNNIIDNTYSFSCRDPNICSILPDIQNLLTTYKKYKVIILLDDARCNVKSYPLPTINHIITDKRLKKIIASQYFAENILAYNVCDHTHTASIASREITPIFTHLLESLFIYNDIYYRGTYFFSIECISIINNILLRTNNLEYAKHLQIFVTNTEFSDIKIILKHEQIILKAQNIEYPYDKSSQYIQGVIEQAISEILISYRKYIIMHNLSICIICFAHNTCKPLLGDKFTIPNAKILHISNKTINFDTSTEHESQDHCLITMLNQSEAKYPAFHQKLDTINCLATINQWGFKPIILSIIIMMLYIIYMIYNNITLEYQIDSINSQYYILSQLYRDILSIYQSKL